MEYTFNHKRIDGSVWTWQGHLCQLAFLLLHFPETLCLFVPGIKRTDALARLVGSQLSLQHSRPCMLLFYAQPRDRLVSPVFLSSFRKGMCICKPRNRVQMTDSRPISVLPLAMLQVIQLDLKCV